MFQFSVSEKRKNYVESFFNVFERIKYRKDIQVMGITLQVISFHYSNEFLSAKIATVA
jgi:hypothetical protein